MSKEQKKVWLYGYFLCITLKFNEIYDTTIILFIF